MTDLVDGVTLTSGTLAVLTSGTLAVGDKGRVLSSPRGRVTCRRWSTRQYLRDAQAVLATEVAASCAIAPVARTTTKDVQAVDLSQIG